MESVYSVTRDVIHMTNEVDLRLLTAVSIGYFITSVLVFTLLVYGITAPYGRYSRLGWGICINVKFAWFVQEIPSFVVPVILMFADAPGLKKAPNVILCSLFLIHYFQR